MPIPTLREVGYRCLGFFVVQIRMATAHQFRSSDFGRLSSELAICPRQSPRSKVLGICVFSFLVLAQSGGLQRDLVRNVQ